MLPQIPNLNVSPKKLDQNSNLNARIAQAKPNVGRRNNSVCVTEPEKPSPLNLKENSTNRTNQEEQNLFSMRRQSHNAKDDPARP